MAALTENPIIVDLTPTYGCMLVGAFLSCMVWGVSSLQTRVQQYLSLSAIWPNLNTLLVSCTLLCKLI